MSAEPQSSQLSTEPVPLPGGLLLRPSTPADDEQVGALLAARGDADDAVDHGLVVQDPDAGHAACAVVVDGDRVVSTALLLDEQVRVGHGAGAVTLPAGQVELVATDRAYEGRGLVRALMAWAHRRSAERGHRLGVMIGIPYFYRQFGYEYAVAIPPAPTLTGIPDAPGSGILRAPTAADLPALTRLQDAVQAHADVAVPHSAPRWRWLLARDGATLWVVERDGGVVATGRPADPADGLLLAEAAAADPAAAADLVAGIARTAGTDGLAVQRRRGHVDDVCAPWYGEDVDRADQYYVRLPDPATVLDALRPTLWQRHVAAGVDRGGRDLVLSTFRRHYRLPVLDDGFGQVQVGGPMQPPGAVGGVGCAPDQLAAVLLGPHGVRGLARLRPDVYCGADPEWYDALFPPVTSDLLMFYLPY
jgi:predicted N-acetyltransferase YhbS